MHSRSVAPVSPDTRLLGVGARGFSVVELLLSLSILVLIAAMTLPAVDRWQRERPIHEATALLLEQLQQARLLAIQQGIPVAFRYESGSSTFQIESGEPRTVRDFHLPEGVHIVSPQGSGQDQSAPLWFSANGTSRDTTLDLSDTEGRTQHIQIRRLTGGAALQ